MYVGVVAVQSACDDLVLAGVPKNCVSVTAGMLRFLPYQDPPGICMPDPVPALIYMIFIDWLCRRWGSAVRLP